MRAEELMIGNSIRINGEFCDSIGYGVITDVYRKQKGLKDSYLDTLTFEPIPLTGEWLLKFGVKLGWGNYDIEFLFNEYHVRYRYDVGSSAFIATIKYVHQLQNLYFALTGEELKLQEDA